MSTPALTPFTGAFVLINETPGQPTSLIASLTTPLQGMFEFWVASLKLTSLPEPDLCTYGKEDSGNGFLYRFRWFACVTLSGTNYGLGANLHSAGAIGSLWLTGVPKHQATPELHPFRAPRNIRRVDFQIYLRGLVDNGTFKRKLKA